MIFLCPVDRSSQAPHVAIFPNTSSCREGASTLAPFHNTGAIGYDAFFGQVPRTYLPAPLQAGRVQPGQRALDVGTGAAAEAATAIVGSSGTVVAGDVSPDMLAMAEKNRQGLPVTLQTFDALTFPFPTLPSIPCSANSA